MTSDFRVYVVVILSDNNINYQQTSNMVIRILRREYPLQKMVSDHEMRNQGAFLLRAGQRALDKYNIINVTIDHELARTRRIGIGE